MIWQVHSQLMMADERGEQCCVETIKAIISAPTIGDAKSKAALQADCEGVTGDKVRIYPSRQFAVPFPIQS